MYHRFNENKYPSTNIKMDIFVKHIQLIKKLNYEFIHPKDFQNSFDIPKKQKKILVTIDDAFQSFYDTAWPFLKENKIPFVLFVSFLYTPSIVGVYEEDTMGSVLQTYSITFSQTWRILLYNIID